MANGFYRTLAIGAACVLLMSMRPSAQSDLLAGLNRAVESMVQQVSPSVVQIVVARYDVQRGPARSDTVDGWEQAIGSGVIVGSDGYIMTNAHVVEHAQRIGVRVVPGQTQSIGDVLSQSFLRPLSATLVGTFPEVDLALLKVSAEGLPALPIAEFDALRQGQMVFAFGSPAGLQNSVSMGVVSSVARQLSPDSPMLYIQTDTAINPGNSGGPLVNTEGQMVGLNTFISTQSGGNEGIGFAIPGTLVRWAYEQLREYGHVHRPLVGAGLQTITPPLAAALKLPRDTGIIVSDLTEGTPAAMGGLKLNDIILSVNGTVMDNVAVWLAVSLQRIPGSALKVRVLRGTQALDLDIVPIEVHEPSDHLADLTDLAQSQVASLGITAVTLDERLASIMGPVRLSSGAVVVARIASPRSADIGLQPGDLIHEVNGRNVYSVEDLRKVADDLQPGDAVALLVERGGRWSYLAFDLP